MMFYIMDSKLPNWSEALQAIVSLIGIPLTIYTLYKLVKKDKERESEIASLSSIASQLKDMLEINEKRYLESKVPHIKLNLKKDSSLNEYVLNFKNLNPNSRITNFSGKNTMGISNNITTSISDIGATQAFSFVIFTQQQSSFSITVNYVVDNQYAYTQEILIHKRNEVYEAYPHRINYIGLETSI